MPIDNNLWINGWPHPNGQGFEAKVQANMDAAATVKVGGDGSVLPAQIAVGGGAQPLQASVGIGGGAPLSASVGAAFTKPLMATLSAALNSMPDLVVKLKEVPRFEVDAPSHVRLGFRIFGFEICALALRGSTKVKSE
jgi:hypothetical protein